MKAAADIIKTHNPFGEVYWASCLRENLTSSSYGEGLETGRFHHRAPRQSLTRQLFFKWIKQHLKIKSFFGTSPNAVKTQIWIAISTYVMIAIIRKMEKIELNLYTILQIFSVSLFEKVPIYQLLTDDSLQTFDCDPRKQLKLFEL